MDRQKKLILVGAGGLLLLALILVLAVLVIRSKNKPDSEPLSTPPTISATPMATPTVTPTTTPTPTSVSPGQPELPGSIATPTATPTTTPTEAGTPDLPVSTATATPKPTQKPTPKPTEAATLALPTTTSAPVTPEPGKVPTGGFAFGLPRSAYTDTIVMVTVLAGNESVTWGVERESGPIALIDAFSGTLTNEGGMIVFKNEGKYILTGTTATGKSYSTSIIVQHSYN